MTRDDDDTVGVDLSAWETPTAPPGLADAVLARLREPSAVAAVEPEQAPPRRRWWFAVAGIAAAAATAAIAIGVLRDTGRDIPRGIGAVATARPSQVDLGAGTTAQLEAATDVSWVRDDHRVAAMQPRGTATWQVARGDQLVIETGAPGRPGPTIVASGASLRVEVDMHLGTQGRVVATSAVTAVAVALITVVVYQGHVEVSGGGETRVVEPGKTIEVRADEAPHEPPTVASDEIGQLRAKIAQLEARLADTRPAAAPIDRDDDTTPATVPVVIVDDDDDTPGEDQTVSNRSPKHHASHEIPSPPSTVDCDDAQRAAARRAEHRGDTFAAAGNYARGLREYEQAFACGRQGSQQKAYLMACKSRNFAKAKFYFQGLPGVYAQICLNQGFDPRKAAP